MTQRSLTPRDMNLPRPLAASYRIHTPDSGSPVRSASPYTKQQFAAEALGVPIKNDTYADVALGKSNSKQNFADVVAAPEVPDIQGRLNAQEKHISRLSEVFEERILHANACVQRVAAENRQRLDELQNRLDERGAMLELRNHIQWAEGRIHQLSARITGTEELTERLKQSALSPEKPTTVRGDLDFVRNEFMTLKAGGIVTPKMLGEAIDPLRRELRQLAERLVQGLNADVSSIVDKLMTEVQQVREASTRSEKLIQLENSGIKQDVEQLSASLKREAKLVCEGLNFIKRKEFNDTTQSMNQELTALTNLVSRCNDTVSKQELRDTAEGIRRDLSSLMVEFSKICNPEVLRNSTLQQNGAESDKLATRKTEELINNLRTEMSQVVDELRTSVLQLVPHCEQSAKMGRMLAELQTEVPKKQEVLVIVDRAMQKYVGDRQRQSDAPLVARSPYSDIDNYGRDNAAMIEHMNRDISDLFGRTSMLRALAVNCAALTVDGAKSGELFSAMSSKRCSKELQAIRLAGNALLPPVAQPNRGSSPGSSLLEKREVASARVSMLMAGKSNEQSVTKEEFLHAVQELRWDLCQIDHMAESGYAAAGKLSELEARLKENQANLVTSSQSVESLTQRLGNQEDGLRNLRSIVSGWLEPDTMNQVAVPGVPQPRIRIPTMFDESERSEPLVSADSFERDLSVLLGRSSLARALAAHAAAGMVTTQSRVADLEVKLQGLKTQIAYSPSGDVVNAGSDSANRDAAWLLSRSSIARGVVMHSARPSSNSPSNDVGHVSNAETANRETAWLLGRVCIARAIAIHNALVS